MARRKKTKFDPKKPRAVNMKVRCSGPRLGHDGFAAEGDVCGTVYLKIMENADNPTELDLRTTHKKCPVCGSDQYENLADYSMRDKTTVVVKHRDY